MNHKKRYPIKMEEVPPPNNHAAGSVDGFDDHADAVDELLEHPPGMPPPAAASVAVDGAPQPQPQPLTLPPPTPLHRSNRKATSNDDGDNAAVPLKEEQMATAVLLAPTDGGQVDGDSVVIDSPVVENQVETDVVQVQVHDPPPALPPPATADAPVPVVEAVVAIGNNATEKRGSDQVATDEGERAESEPVTKKLKTEEETLLDANNESAVTAAGAGASSGSSSTQQAGRKERLEFTAAEKLHILSLVESNQNRTNTSSMNPTRTTGDDKEESQQPMTAKQIREKFNVSKSSLHRWKQQKSRLQTLVNQGSGMGDRKRDTRDLTLKLKFGLKKFAEENATKDATEMLAITTPVIMAKAVLIQEDLIKGYEEAIGAELVGGESNKSGRNKPLTEEEYNAIKEFKVTKGWAGRVGSSMGLLSCPRVRRQKKKEKSTVLPNDDANKAEIAPAEAMGWGETSTPQTTEQAKKNTENFLFQFNPNDGISKPKKDRREFTAIDKLQILEEMDDKKLKMEEVCAKWNTSKSSVFRWKIQRKNGQLNTMINDEKGGHSKRVVEDRLLKIKLELKMFVDVNAALPVNDQVSINSTILQMKASEARDQLLLQHMSLPSGLLTNDEVIALQNFKASKGWARKVADRYGWKIANRRDDGLIDVGTSLLAERPNLTNNTGVDSATLASIRKNAFEEETPGNVPPQLDLPPGLNVPVAHDGKNEMNQDLVHPTTGIAPAHNPPAPLVAQMAVVDGPRALGGFDSSSLQHLPPLHDPHAPPEEQAEQELVNETVDSVIDNITIAL